MLKARTFDAGFFISKFSKYKTMRILTTTRFFQFLIKLGRKQFSLLKNFCSLSMNLLS